MPAKPRIGIDFDGTLCQYDGWHSDHSALGEPVIGALESCQLLAEDYELVVITAREELEPVEKWLRQHDFPPMEVTRTKLGCLVLIDDRCVRFDGSWALMMRWIRSMPPAWWEDPR